MRPASVSGCLARVESFLVTPGPAQSLAWEPPAAQPEQHYTLLLVLRELAQREWREIIQLMNSYSGFKKWVDFEAAIL